MTPEGLRDLWRGCVPRTPPLRRREDGLLHPWRLLRRSLRRLVCITGELGTMVETRDCNSGVRGIATEEDCALTSVLDGEDQLSDEMPLRDNIENLLKLVEDIIQVSISTGPQGVLWLAQGIQAFIGVGGEWINGVSKELKRREEAAARAGIVIEEKNWPPFFPIIHHDIANEIPIHLQRLQYVAFASYLGNMEKEWAKLLFAD